MPDDPFDRNAPGARLLCCTVWHPLTRLPFITPCCGRVFLVRRVVEPPVVPQDWWWCDSAAPHPVTPREPRPSGLGRTDGRE